MSVLALALFAAGCKEGRTEVVVVVNKYGITIGRDVDGLSLIVKTHASDTDPVFSLADHPLCPDDGPAVPGCWSLPVTATLVPGPDDPNDPVVVQVLGLRSGTQVIGDQATFHFLKHVSQRLDFILYANCLNVDCTTQDAACDFNGQCMTITPTNFTGEPQLDGLPPFALPDLGSRDLFGRDLEPIDLAGVDLTGRDLNMMSMMDMSNDMSMSMPGDSSFSQDSSMAIWVQKTSGTSTNLRAIWGSAVGDLFAVGDGGLILHSGDAGETWQSENNLDTHNLYSVWGTSDAVTVFAVGDSGTILQRSGGVWALSANPWTLPISDLRGVWGDVQNDFWVVGGGQTLGQWDGNTWNPVCGIGDNSDSYHSVWGRRGTDVWIAGIVPSNAPFVGHLTTAVSCAPGPPSGPPPSGPPMPDLSMTCACPIMPVTTETQTENGVTGDSFSTEWVAGGGGDVRVCDSSCSADFISGVNTLNSVWAQSLGGSVIAVGDAGTILRRVSSWTPETSPTSNNLRGVWGLDSGTGVDSGTAWAVGDSGTILKRQ